MRNYVKLCLLPCVPTGDFDIPSSREDVDRDSPWNQWLRSEVPQLFLQAMDVFRVSTEQHRKSLWTEMYTVCSHTQSIYRWLTN